MRALGQIMKFVCGKSKADDPSSFDKICKAGKLLGLDTNDITRLSQVSKAARIKGYASRHVFIFVLIAAFAYLFLLLIASASPPQTGSQNTYPAGARYCVISIKDFQRGGQLSRRWNDTRWRLVRVR